MNYLSVAAYAGLVLLTGYNDVTYAACYEYEFSRMLSSECTVFYSSVTISTCSGTLINKIPIVPGSSFGHVYYWNKYKVNPDGTRTFLAETGYCLKSKEDEIFDDGPGCCVQKDNNMGPPLCVPNYEND